jgi:hypothetical protein
MGTGHMDNIIYFALGTVHPSPAYAEPLDSVSHSGPEYVALEADDSENVKPSSRGDLQGRLTGQGSS